MNERTLRLGRRLPTVGSPAFAGPDWAQASPARIRSALEHALALPSGGWYAVDASRSIASGPKHYQIAGQQLVAWRDAAGVAFAYDECPHLGAALSAGRVCAGKLVCPWHGLALGRERHGAWAPLRAFDDGVLCWVRLDTLSRAAGRERDEELSERPFLAPRPQRFLEGTIRMEARCEPSDVIANRLDPWHGAHFHPKVFTNLVVTEASDERLCLRVQYRVAGPLVVEVDASFHCPNPRSIVMTIVAGEGVGSVVETHATPIGPGRTAILETTLASSERLGFRLLTRLSAWMRPFVERKARSLWIDDAAYAERSYVLRTGGSALGIELPSDADGRGQARESRLRVL
jgi:isorenieratene synthase